MFRYFNTAAGLAAAVLSLSTAGVAHAQQMQPKQRAPCDDRGKILNKLGSDYAERRISLGLAANGNLLEILASKSGSWTMIYTTPNGGSCVLATGQSWIDVEPTPARPAVL